MNKKNSFKRGFMQVKQQDVPAVKAEIMAGLSLTSRMGWNQRLNGKITPKQSDVVFIENVFKKYGIIDVWGSMTPEELSDSISHLRREIQETVQFAYMMLGYNGLDMVVSESLLLSVKIRSGELSPDSIVETIN